DDPSAPDLKDLYDYARRPELHAEDVAMTELGGRHFLLPDLQRLDGAHGVAHLRRFLEALGGSGIDHARPKRLDQLVVPAFEEQSGHRHRPAVLVGGAHGVHARRDAALDVVLEAGPPPLAGNHLVARPYPEQPMGQRHRPAGEMRRQERTGIEAAIAL